jgi:hypothetical protein
MKGANDDDDVTDGAGPAYAGPASCEAERATVCSLCGSWFETCDPDEELCEDCGLPDCAYCGVTTHRPLLSENLACVTCEEGAA